MAVMGQFDQRLRDFTTFDYRQARSRNERIKGVIDMFATNGRSSCQYVSYDSSIMGQSRNNCLTVARGWAENVGSSQLRLGLRLLRTRSPISFGRGTCASSFTVPSNKILNNSERSSQLPKCNAIRFGFTTHTNTIRRLICF